MDHGQPLSFVFLISLRLIQQKVLVDEKVRSETAHIVESFEFFGEIVFKQNGISSEFDGFQRHGPVDSRESIDTLGPFNHMIDIGRQHFRICAFGALEFFAWNDLDRWFFCDICHQEIHSDIFAIHVIVNPLSDLRWQFIGVRIAPILVVECCSCQYHGDLIRPLRFISPAQRVIFPNVCATGKSNNSIGKLTPHFEAKVQFISGKHDNVIVDG